MTNIASGDQLFVNSLIGNSDQKANSKFITFYKTYSGLGLLISSIISRGSKTHLTGCIGEIIGFYRSLTDIETSYIHKHLMKKWEIAD